MMIAEGQEPKIVEEAGDGEVLVRSKDDITPATEPNTMCRWQGCRIHADDLQHLRAPRAQRRTPTSWLVCDDVTFRARNVEHDPTELVHAGAPPAAFENRFLTARRRQSSKDHVRDLERCITTSGPTLLRVLRGTCPTEGGEAIGRTPGPATSSPDLERDLFEDCARLAGQEAVSKAAGGARRATSSSGIMSTLRARR